MLNAPVGQAFFSRYILLCRHLGQRCYRESFSLGLLTGPGGFGRYPLLDFGFVLSFSLLFAKPLMDGLS